MDTKDNENDTSQVITSDNPYGSHPKKTSKFKLPGFLSKSSHMVTAIVVVALVAGIGTYLLVTSHAATVYGPITGIASKCLDDANDSAVNGNKIQLWDCWSNDPSQQWSFNLASNGTGTIVNANSYCLDVYGASVTAGTKVDMYQCNGTVAQVWEVNSSTGTIINPHSGLCLDDTGAITTDGNQIMVWNCNGGSNQKWVVSSSTANPPVSTGTATYGPITGIASKCLDDANDSAVNNNKIQLWDCWSGDPSQQWAYNLTSNGTGTIENTNGYCLGTSGTAAGSLAVMYQCNNTSGQVWQVNSSTGTIINPNTGYCLDDTGAVTTDGNQIMIWYCNGGSNQKWVVSSSSVTKPVASTGTAPAITSTSSTTFTAGTAGSFTVKDTGSPVPTLSESGTLPSGITFNTTSGVLSGTTSSTGIYDISFTASNYVSPNATQSFVLSVISAPVTNPPSSGSSGSSGSASISFPDSLFDSGKVQSWPQDPNSAEYVADFVSDYQNNYGSVGVNTSPMYTVAANTPMSTMSVASGCNGFTSNTGTQIPIPTYAQSNGSGDNPMAIYQPSTNSLWEFWQAHSTSSTTWTACWGGKISSVSTSSAVFPAPFGLSASGISYYATSITEADVQSGAINHAINVILPPNCNTFVYPADRGDCSSHPGQPSEGSYFRLPTSVNCSNQANKFADMVCTAIQKYGMVVGDQGGAVMLGAEQFSDWSAEGNTGTDPISASWNGAQEYQVVANLPWSQMQVVDPPNPYTP